MSNKFRTIIVTWIVVYPIITMLIAILKPVVGTWPMTLRTLLVSAFMVPLMVAWAMPFATARFGFFLNPKAAQKEDLRSVSKRGDSSCPRHPQST